jgi:hypothetical protein
MLPWRKIFAKNSRIMERTKKDSQLRTESFHGARFLRKIRASWNGLKQTPNPAPKASMAQDFCEKLAHHGTD